MHNRCIAPCLRASGWRAKSIARITVRGAASAALRPLVEGTIESLSRHEPREALMAPFSWRYRSILAELIERVQPRRGGKSQG
jgi:hypothetical protein